MTRITELVRYAAKALVAAAAPIVTKLVVDVLDVISADAENWIAVAAGAVAVYLVPNRKLPS